MNTENIMEFNGEMTQEEIQKIGCSLKKMGDSLDSKYQGQAEGWPGAEQAVAWVEGQARRVWGRARDSLVSGGGAFILLNVAVTVLILNHR